MSTLSCDSCGFQAWQSAQSATPLKHCSHCGAPLSVIEALPGETPTVIELDMNEVEARQAVLLLRGLPVYRALLDVCESPRDAMILTASFLVEACAITRVDPRQFLELIVERWPRRETS